MENKSHALAAGAFVLAMLGLLAALVLWLSRDRLEPRLYAISSPYSVGGLQPQAAVRYKGVQVGRVADIALDTNQPGNVLLRIALDDSVPITRSTYASLGLQGVTGLAFVQLDDPSPASAALPAGTVQDSAEAATLPRIPMRQSQVAQWADQGSALLTQLEQASTRMNALLSPDNERQLLHTLGQLGQAAEQVSALSQDARHTLRAIDTAQWQRLASQADTTLLHLQTTAERLGDSADVVRNSAAEFQRTNRRMNEPGGTLDRIERSSNALRSTASQMQSQLLPRLGRSADAATRSARQFGQAAQTLDEQPGSLLWGRSAGAPGPGEAGFVPPPSRQTLPVTGD